MADLMSAGAQRLRPASTPHVDRRSPHDRFCRCRACKPPLASARDAIEHDLDAADDNPAGFFQALILASGAGLAAWLAIGVLAAWFAGRL